VFDPLFDGLATALAFFYDIWPSYGGAIILFTLAVMLVLSPLAIKSTRSMIRMQRLQPELKKLQAKHKEDREALNREMMAFYKANNVNPFSSCLPLLLQMPVFIVLYQVLSGLTKKVDGTFEPKYLDHTSSLYRDLTGTDEMLSFGMDLSRSAVQALEDGVLPAIPYILLVAVVVVTSFVQQRQIQGRNPNASTMSAQQQMIGRIMPFIFIPISISLPAGVVVYFAVSNLVRVGQQALVTKLEFSHEKADGAKPKPRVRDAEATPKDTGGDGGGSGGGKADGGKPATGRKPAGKGPGGKPSGNGAGGTRSPTNGARRSGTPAGSGARSRNRKRKRK
jgi:YidC/Oxa1 family membrane protein insertase